MNPTIIRLATRSLLGRARVLALFALSVAILGLSALTRAATGGTPDPSGAPLTLVHVVGIGVVIPLAALIGTTTLITSEIDDGSIIHLLSKPLSRRVLVTSKMVVVLASTFLFAVLPLTVSTLIMVGTAGGLWWGSLLGGTVCALAYTGAFTLLALVAPRSITGCVLYWLVWESLLTPLLDPAQYASAGAYGRSVVALAMGQAAAQPPAWFAIPAAVLVLLIGVGVAGRRLARVTIT